MTTEEETSGGAAEPQTTEAPTTPAAPALRTAISKLSPAEQLIALGALIIVVFVDLIGDVLLDAYSVSSLFWGSALGALGLIWLKHFRKGQGFVPDRMVLVIIGYAGGVTGLRELLADFDVGFRLAGVLFALAGYGGAWLMAWGAYRLSKAGTDTES